MKAQQKRKAREWWVHRDSDLVLYACETWFASTCGCCVPSRRILVRQVLPRKAAARRKKP